MHYRKFSVIICDCSNTVLKMLCLSGSASLFVGVGVYTLAHVSIAINVGIATRACKVEYQSIFFDFVRSCG